MPELPEVETIRRGLEKYLVGKRISSIEVRFAKLFSGDPNDILDQEILSVQRFGKGLVINFANEKSIVAHVKMTGQFIYVSDKQTAKSKQKPLVKNFHPKLALPGELPHKHTHVIFKLQAMPVGRQVLSPKSQVSSTLYYNDIRKFGWIKILKTGDVQNLSFFKSLGKELPLTGLPGTMALAEFKKIILSSGAPIKSVIMDQAKIAGVGNIYANDGLFLAKIDPRRKANTLNKEETKLLYESLIVVLEKGLMHGGASEVNYIHVDGQKGGYQNHFLVYGRTGEKCSICGTSIERLVVGGRGTFFCPHCQN